MEIDDKDFQERLKKMEQDEELAKARQILRVKGSVEVAKVKEALAPSDPKDKEAIDHNDRAVELHEKGRSLDALKEIREALKINPAKELYKKNLGVITEDYADSLLQVGLYDEVLGQLERLEQEGLLRGGDGYWMLGRAHLGKGNYDEAIEAYKEAIKYLPLYPGYHYALADAYYFKAQAVDEKDQKDHYYQKSLEEIGLSLQSGSWQPDEDKFLRNAFKNLLLKKIKDINI